MTLIHVPKPNLMSAMDPNRPVNALLRAQVEHLGEAELKLPIGKQTDIYVNAIKTEGEAADYIRRVTEAIHRAHKAGNARRARPKVKRKHGIKIAASAEEQPTRKGTGTRKSKKSEKRPMKQKR